MKTKKKKGGSSGKRAKIVTSTYRGTNLEALAQSMRDSKKNKFKGH